MNARDVCLLAIVMFPLPVRGDDLQKLGEEISHFYLTPSRERYEHLQSDSDRLASSLQKKGNVDLLAAVLIAAASQKHHWEIIGKGEISGLAREIVTGKSKVARYVSDDAIVDVGKLDVWWADFCGTGESK